ncbi:MAG: DUF6600 domain-containing protein [Thermoanaerobaculia bacterium]
MKTTRLTITAALAAVVLLAATARAERADRADRSDRPATRSGYSYLREMTGDVSVVSKWNGRVDARRNMPISSGDEIVVSESGRAEVGLADGNVLHVGGGTSARFESLYAQQGEDDEFSAIRLKDGSVVLSATGANDGQIPRIDTDDATVYLSAGSRARVNADPRRGTVVIARLGAVEVRTPEGSYKLKPGQYLLVHGEDEPTIERGTFSRDRFDTWSADRLDSLGATRSVSARYVDEEYADEVVALDGYGDWNYSNTYSSYVWSPRVNAGWTPYNDGSWYYTTAGLTWWSNDPWGWYPHHYGNWFFESSWNRWCWSPAYVYSPAWVYWAYTPSYVGWCPVGYYTGYSPWWDSYYRHIGWNRSNVYLPVHGTFNTRQVDFRGWNFTGAGRFGSGVGRAEVIRGDRIGDRLGSQVAISSRPIVLSGRGGDTQEAMRNYIREAPRVIERSAAADSGRLAPVLGRERTLPTATVEALRDRAVVAERGRLAGPAAAEIAPRGVRIERGRPLGEPIPPREALGTDRGRAGSIDGPARRDPIARGRAADLPAPAPGDVRAREPVTRGRVSDDHAPASRFEDRAPARADQDWRSHGRAVERDTFRGNPAPSAPSSGGPGAERLDRSRPDTREVERARPDREAPSGDWRSRRMPAPPAENPSVRREEASPSNWRSRSEVPPARRVIEGSVPRRDPEAVRERPMPRDERPAYRPERSERAAPSYAPAPPPPPRVESRPAPPPPRAEAHAPPPPRAESHPAPPPARAPERGRKD